MSEATHDPVISPFLWFDQDAGEAVDFYLSVFPNARRLGGLTTGGKVVTVSFELEGQNFLALNGGPHFKFNEAVSFVVRCKDQAEIDHYWSKLTADGGKESQCGWLKDKFGLSWQIVPADMPALLSKPGAMQAMMGMKKLVIAELEAAGRG